VYLHTEYLIILNSDYSTFLIYLFSKYSWNIIDNCFITSSHEWCISYRHDSIYLFYIWWNAAFTFQKGLCYCIV